MTRWNPAVGAGITLFFGFQRLIFLIEILPHDIAEVAEIDAAGGHHLGGIGIVDQRQQQMFERGIFMAAFGRLGERRMQGFFKALGETGHHAPSLAGATRGNAPVPR